jgi:uncharacterized membrane protein
MGWRSGESRSHWRVAGPAGTTVEWNAVITKSLPNDVLAWKSEPDSIVQHAGIVHFTDNGDATTTVNIQMSYNPPGGVLGHAVATVFGADPKSQLDEDLMRMKSLIETGKAPSDASASHCDA